jgi:chorismate mutase
MDEIRKAIDDLDRSIVSQIRLRYQYISQAGLTKTDRNKILDQERKEKVIDNAVREAVASGMPYEGIGAVEVIWETLVNSSINYEYRVFDEANNPGK